MWCRYHIKCSVCGKITNLRLHIAGNPHQDVSFLCGECKSSLGGDLELYPEKAQWNFVPSNCEIVERDFLEGDYFVEFSEAFPTSPPTKEPHHMLTPFMRNLPEIGESGFNKDEWILKPNKNEWRELPSVNRAYLKSDRKVFDKIASKYSEKIYSFVEYNPKNINSTMFGLHIWFFGEFIDQLELSVNRQLIIKYLSTKDAVKLNERYLFFHDILDLGYFNKWKQEIFDLLENFAKRQDLIRPALMREIGKQLSDTDEFIPNEDFDSVRNLYTDIFETLGRLLSIPFGLINIDQRGSYNSLPTGLRPNKNTWEDFLQIANGIKLSFVNSNRLWPQLYRDSFDNQVRNGINHHKAFH